MTTSVGLVYRVKFGIIMVSILVLKTRPNPSGFFFFLSYLALYQVGPNTVNSLYNDALSDHFLL